MAMNKNLFTGQCESVEKLHVTNTPSAKTRTMPTHAGNEPVSLLLTPRRRKRATSKK